MLSFQKTQRKGFLEVKEEFEKGIEQQGERVIRVNEVFKTRKPEFLVVSTYSGIEGVMPLLGMNLSQIETASL